MQQLAQQTIRCLMRYFNKEPKINLMHWALEEKREDHQSQQDTSDRMYFSKFCTNPSRRCWYVNHVVGYNFIFVNMQYS